MQDKKYSERLVRHTAEAPGGELGEVLERITLESQLQADGSWSEPAFYSRRFDMQNGQLVRLTADQQFEILESGLVLRPVEPLPR
jgi:hypothetical protein